MRLWNKPGTLNLFQIVDADDAFMPFFRQEHFDEIGEHGEFELRRDRLKRGWDWRMLVAY